MQFYPVVIFALWVIDSGVGSHEFVDNQGLAFFEPVRGKHGIIAEIDCG